MEIYHSLRAVVNSNSVHELDIFAPKICKGYNYVDSVFI